MGVDEERIYIDHGYTGRNRERPALEKAQAACREGDEFCVASLDRMARSIIDAHQIAKELEDRGVKLNIGGTIYDPKDPVSGLFFSILAAFAQFQVELIRKGTREGLAVAKEKGRLKGKPPKLNAKQEKHLIGLWRAGTHNDGDLAEIFGVARSTVYRTRKRVEAREAV